MKSEDSTMASKKEILVKTTEQGKAGKVKVPKETPQSTLMAIHALNATCEDKPIPPDVRSSDIYVKVSISLDRPQDKEDKEHVELATEVQKAVQEKLSALYTQSDREKAKLALQVYVVLASEGNTWNKLTLGLTGQPIEECLSWFLESAEGGTLYKSGRVGGKEIGLFSFSDSNVLVNKLTPRLVEEIVDRVNIRDT